MEIGTYNIKENEDGTFTVTEMIENREFIFDNIEQVLMKIRFDISNGRTK